MTDITMHSTAPPPWSDEAALCGKFACAISPDGMAVLLDENNKSPRRVSVSEALTLGAAFAVNTYPWVLALDLDEPRDWDCAEVVMASLPPGFRTIRVASGAPGRGHLWVIALPGWHREAFKDLVVSMVPEWGLTQIRAGMPTRPPYAPHRTPGRPRARIKNPDVETALSWFLEARPRPLPEKMHTALMTSDPELLVKGHGKPSPGMTVGAAAMSAVGARWDFQDFERLVLGSTGLASEKYRTLSRTEARIKLQRVWERAMVAVRESPRVPYPTLRRHHLDDLRRAMSLVPWRPRTASTDRKVYTALLGLAGGPGSLVVGASVRQLAKDAGVYSNTVSASLRRLEELKLIRRKVTAGQAYSHQFELLDYRETYVDEDNRINPTGWGGPVGLTVATKALLDDIFTNGAGLGGGCAETWNALQADWQGTDDVVKRTGKTRPTTRAHIRALVTVGLAERDGHCVRRRVPGEDELRTAARLLGVEGKRRRMAAVLTNQQEGYRQFYEAQGWLHPSNPQPGIVR